MEQDRTPAVLPHHSDLARQTPDQPRNGGRTDRLHHDQDRSDGAMRARYARLPEGHQGQLTPRWRPSISRATHSIRNGIIRSHREHHLKRLSLGVALALLANDRFSEGDCASAPGDPGILSRARHGRGIPLVGADRSRKRQRPGCGGARGLAEVPRHRADLAHHGRDPATPFSSC